MKTLTISFCVLFLLITLVLPVSAEPELYFGEVETLDDESKMVSLMVRDVNNLGSCDAIIKFEREGVEVTDVTQGNGNNALTLKVSNIDNTAGSVRIAAWDESTGYNGDVVICNIVYNGSDSNPFKIDSAELFEYTYDKIQHTGNNDIVRSTVKPTATKVADDSATSVETISKGEAGGEGVVVESTQIADETNGSSGEDNNGIPGFGLLTSLSIMFIVVRLLRENK